MFWVKLMGLKLTLLTLNEIYSFSQLVIFLKLLKVGKGRYSVLFIYLFYLSKVYSITYSH